MKNKLWNIKSKKIQLYLLLVELLRKNLFKEIFKPSILVV